MNILWVYLLNFDEVIRMIIRALEMIQFSRGEWANLFSL